jgi:hypothetical protein
MASLDRQERFKLKKLPKQERVIFSLPKALIEDLRKYAGLVRGGNKSGFVADALKNYITYLHKREHTRKLRESYAAAARHSQKISTEWDVLSDESWDMIH